MQATSTTFAAHVAACMTCRTPVQALILDGEGSSVIEPCGHPASIILIPNPALAAEQED